MNRFHLLSLALAVSLAPAISFGDWHTFTSADGSKKLEAEVQGYDLQTGVAQLRLRDGRKISTPATAFSEEDQEHLKEIGLAFDMGRSIWVEFDDVQEVISEKRNPTNGYQTMTLENGFKFEVRNNGTIPFEGLTAEYQVFYAAYKDPFADSARTAQVMRGEVEIPALEPRAETHLSTEKVGMTSIKRLPISECVGGT